MQGISILIVDDSYQMRRTIRSFLADLVDRFYECSDGSQALEAYTDHHPDLILMDVKMKEMDGLAAMAQILSSFPQAKVVIITDYDDDDVRRAASHAGACAFVKKAELMQLRSLIVEGFQSTDSIKFNKGENYERE